MTNEALKDAIEQLTGYIQRDVSSGFGSPGEIVDSAVEIVADEYDGDDLRPHAERVLRETIEAQLQSQATWPDVTDCDRFDAAFTKLEAVGIVCRHHFSCCGTCAAGEIWDEIDAERAKGREIIGCAHYNVQGTEGAVEGGSIWLSYGSTLDTEEAAVDIGHKICDAMRSEGLQVTWNGTLSQCIHVKLDWKRRMPESWHT